MLRSDQKLANGAGSGYPHGFLLYRSIEPNSAPIVHIVCRTSLESSLTCYRLMQRAREDSTPALWGPIQLVCPPQPGGRGCVLLALMSSLRSLIFGAPGESSESPTGTSCLADLRSARPRAGAGGFEPP